MQPNLGQTYFIGVVEDNNDPKYLGRVRVRIQGTHSSKISTGDLPWAMVSIPTTEGGVSGLGRISGLLAGTTVHGIFLDGPAAQIPLIMGALSKTEKATHFQVDDNFGYSMGMRPTNLGIDSKTPDYNLGKPLTGFGFTDKLGYGNAEKAFNYFRLEGFTVVQASAIVGNLMRESGVSLDPTIKQGNKGVGRGIAQWSVGGRFDTDRNNLVGFAGKAGKPWTDFEVQLMFISQEMRILNKFNLAEFKRTVTIDEATKYFQDEYEGGKDYEPRRVFAHQIYSQLSSRSSGPRPRQKFLDKTKK